jgi:hypothetical protein
MLLAALQRFYERRLRSLYLSDFFSTHESGVNGLKKIDF